MDKKVRVGRNRVMHNKRQRLTFFGSDVDIRKKVDC